MTTTRHKWHRIRLNEAECQHLWSVVYAHTGSIERRLRAYGLEVVVEHRDRRNRPPRKLDSAGKAA